MLKMNTALASHFAVEALCYLRRLLWLSLDKRASGQGNNVR